MWWGKEIKVIKHLLCALKAPFCSYRDSDSGLEGIFEPIWSLFQGVPSTTTQQGGPLAESSQGWADCYSEKEPIRCWANPITRQPFPEAPASPIFSPLGLASLQLSWVSCQERKPMTAAAKTIPKSKTCPSWDAYFCSHGDESTVRPLCSISKFDSGIRPG